MNYKEEIQKFILHSVTSHSTTGKTPTELLMNRTIRDTVLSISDVIGESIDEARDAGLTSKYVGKLKKDRAIRSCRMP